MIADPQPYPAMKDSGVEWLGEVPAHWKVLRLKQICRLAYGDSLADTVRRDGAVPVLGSNGRVGFHDSANTKAPCIVIGRKGSFGKVNYSPDPAFAIDTTFFVDSRFSSANIRWLFYLLRWLRLDEVTRDSAIPGLDREDTYQRPGALPPLSEQAAIVRFLDRADRRIRRCIRAKQKLITLLEEQKQAIIHQAVTGQIDVRTERPYPAYKDSGVEWLGEIPAHWQLLRLKDVASVQTGITLGKDYRSTQTISRPYLRVANVQDGHLKLAHVKTVDVPVSEVEGATLLSGDVLMTEGGDIDKLGRGCVWRDEVPGCLHQNHIFAVRCRRRLLSPEFLVRLMGSQHGRTYFELTAKRTTNLASTNSSTLRAFPVPLPVAEEQAKILDAISEQTNVLDDAMDRAAREIELMREYHTRLIADVVTGKLDVREAAAGLPEVDPLAAEGDSVDGVDHEAGSEHTVWRHAVEEGDPLADVADA